MIGPSSPGFRPAYICGPPQPAAASPPPCLEHASAAAPLPYARRQHPWPAARPPQEPAAAGRVCEAQHAISQTASLCVPRAQLARASHARQALPEALPRLDADATPICGARRHVPLPPCGPPVMHVRMLSARRHVSGCERCWDCKGGSGSLWRCARPYRSERAGCGAQVRPSTSALPPANAVAYVGAESECHIIWSFYGLCYTPSSSDMRPTRSFSR